MVTFFECVVRTLGICSLSQLQAWNMLLLTLATMLAIRSPELTHLQTGSLYLWPTSPRLPHPTAPAPTTSLCFNEHNCSDSSQKWRQAVFVFVFELFHLSECSQVRSRLSQKEDFLFFNGRRIFHCVYIFFSYKRVCVCVYETSLFTHPFIRWRTPKLFPCLSYCAQCFSEHRGANISSM